MKEVKERKETVIACHNFTVWKNHHITNLFQRNINIIIPVNTNINLELQQSFEVLQK